MAKTEDVEIKKKVYIPETVTIEVGDTVKWTNRDLSRHTATREKAPTFDTGKFGKDESRSITFTEATDAGGIEYFCRPHPKMRGHVVVMLPGSSSRAYSLEDDDEDDESEG